MGKYDESDGVWRTVGGRRIFIRDGQSLSSAMKESGKFKGTTKQGEVPTKSTLNTMTEKNSDIAEKIIADDEWNDVKVTRYGNGNAVIENERTGQKVKITPSDTKESLSRKIEDSYKEENNKVKSLSGKNETDNKGREVSQKEYDEFRQAYREGKISKEDYRNDNYDALKRKEMTAQEASENQLKRMWGEYKDVADLRDEYENKVLSKTEAKRKYGTDNEEIINAGKEKSERVSIVKDEYYDKLSPEQKKTIDNAYKKGIEQYNKDVETGKRIAKNAMSVKSQQSDIEKASGLKVKRAFESDDFGNGKEDRFQLEDGRYISHSKESLGAKDDTWSINKVENGSIKSQDFKSYDDMIKHLSSSSNSKTSTGYSQKELDNVWKKQDATEVTNYLTKSEQNKLQNAYDDYEFYKDSNAQHAQTIKDYIQRTENKAATKFLDNQKSNENKTTSNNAYKNAFEEYKKKHPNTKLNLQKFIDMSEGK